LREELDQAKLLNAKLCEDNGITNELLQLDQYKLEVERLRAHLQAINNDTIEGIQLTTDRHIEGEA